jgi:hypothetical protein
MRLVAVFLLMCNKLCNWGDFCSGRLTWSGRWFALDGRVTLDAFAAFNTSGRQASGRSGFVRNAGRAGNTLLAAQLSNADFPPLGHLEQFGSCTRLSNAAL